MRLDPWKLAAIVLFVACVDEVARPDVAHAPGSADAATSLESSASEHAPDPAAVPPQSPRERE